MADNECSSFGSMKFPEPQHFLKGRDIQKAVDGKKRKRAELLELCKNATEMRLPNVYEKIELQDEKLLFHPLLLHLWTHNFTNIPGFRFPDIYHYLVCKDGYGEACLQLFKAFRVFAYTWTVTWRI